MSDFQALTDWYPLTTKPARSGLYLLRERFHEWDGGRLLLWQEGRWRWIDECPINWISLTMEWRGLAFDPGAVRYTYEILDRNGAVDVYAIEMPIGGSDE